MAHSDKQERIVFSVKLQAELWNGHCQQRSNRIEKVNFVAASRPDSPVRPRLRQDDWRQGIASDKELMDRAIGKLVGTGGSAVSFTSGQLPTSAEIEEVGGSRAGHWTGSSMLRKRQHVKCILRATSDGWQACLHGIRSRRRAVTN